MLEMALNLHTRQAVIMNYEQKKMRKNMVTKNLKDPSIAGVG